MREILFKAKRKDRSEWIEGYFAIICEKTVIIEKESEKYYSIDDEKNSRGNRIIEINPKTLCQFTGLCDKNGKKIWENDIVLVAESVYSTVKFGLYHEASKSERTHQGFYLESMDKYYYREELGYWAKESVVVGNIFDNKELLQEESDE